MGWLWLLASVLLLTANWHRRGHRNAGLAAALSLSAIINLLTCLLVANAPFFRYYYWTVSACAVVWCAYCSGRTVNTKQTDIHTSQQT